MLIRDWWKMAKIEQNIQKNNHLYENYLHSRRAGLLRKEALKAFVAALHEVPDNIDADVAIQKAEDKQSTLNKERSVEDFRLCGQVIKADARSLWLNVSIIICPPEAASDPAKGTKARPSPSRIIWLTSCDAFVRKIGSMKSKSERLDERRFFREAVDLLGLKCWRPERDGNYSCRLRLFALKTADSLVRPHVFSGGTADRFCGGPSMEVSPGCLGGSTADNRTAEPSLPEAICREKDLDEITPDAIEYESFKNKLAPFLSWEIKREIAAVLPWATLYDNLPFSYGELQWRYIERLRTAPL